MNNTSRLVVSFINLSVNTITFLELSNTNGLKAIEMMKLHGNI